eukprot:1453701-Pleurochrysis_carterae.AAC.1
MRSAHAESVCAGETARARALLDARTSGIEPNAPNACSRARAHARRGPARVRACRPALSRTLADLHIQRDATLRSATPTLT